MYYDIEITQIVKKKIRLQAHNEQEAIQKGNMIVSHDNPLDEYGLVEATVVAFPKNNVIKFSKVMSQ